MGYKCCALVGGCQYFLCNQCSVVMMVNHSVSSLKVTHLRDLYSSYKCLLLRLISFPLLCNLTMKLRSSVLWLSLSSVIFLKGRHFAANNQLRRVFCISAIILLLLPTFDTHPFPDFVVFCCVCF